MGVKYLLTIACTAASLLASAQGGARWAVVLPFGVETDSSGSGITKNAMATEFYAGFRAALDSFAGSEWPITLDVYDFDEATGQVVDHAFGSALPRTLSPLAFMNEQARLDVRYVVGPFRGSDSESLAKHAAATTYVVNPVSREVRTEGLPQLIAAAPVRFLEAEVLGRLAAHDALSRPKSRTVIFDLGDKASMLQRQAFVRGYHAMGADTTKIQTWDGRPTSNLAARVGGDDLVPTRFVLLDDKVLSAARILQGLRQRPASQTEFWTVSSTVNSPSLDAFLLLRQPIIWAQTDRLEFAQYEDVDAHIASVLGTSRSRWAWLGYDIALMLLESSPEHTKGPRRSYDWGQTTGGGQFNQAIELYRFDPSRGVNPVALPALP
ncbi:MAG: hypothetical protein RL753_628 [Bacteroidota bacterium]